MTAPVFHRLTVPTYFGGLPATYDYVNNAISGTPAFADTQKSSGPNAGTYFVAFGEDATSTDANRANAALATNTDHLDDLMHQDLALPVRTNDVGPTGSPTASVTLVGPGIFLGNTGGYLLKDLFHITDAGDNDINVGGVTVLVASISGGAVGSGFSAGNVTLTLNVSIPTGTTYHVYYGARTNLAVLPVDALTSPRLRSVVQVSEQVEDIFLQITQPGTLGETVSAVVGSVFQTPQNGRLSQNNIMTMDVDPEDVGATQRFFRVRTRRDTGASKVMFEVFDDPTSLLLAGVTGLAQVPSGTAFGSAGTGFFTDANVAGGTPTGVSQIVPLSDSGAGVFPRIMGKKTTLADYGATPPSLLQMINGRMCATVGDGVNTFGDFNGTGGVDAALTYYVACGASSLYLYIKSGTYACTVAHTLGGQDVHIEGEGAAFTQLQVNLSGTTPYITGSSVTMTFERFRATRVTGASTIFVDGGAASGSIYLRDVYLIDENLILRDPVAVSSKLPALHAERCLFETLTTATLAIDVRVSDGNPHVGFYLDRCSFVCSNETRPFRIFAAGGISAGTTVDNVVFNGCTYQLGSTSTTSSHLTTNVGVLTIEHNGSSGHLIVESLLWQNCNVFGGNGAGSTILAKIMPTIIGQTNTSAGYAYVQKVEILGGRWSCDTAAGSSAASAFSPMFICARQIIIRDVDFLGNGLSLGGPDPGDGPALLGGSGAAPSAAQWAAFTFSVGLSIDDQNHDPKGRGIVLENVNFRNLCEAQTCGDLRLDLPGSDPGNVPDTSASSSIRQIRFSGYAAGGGGGSPGARVAFVPATGTHFNVSTVVEDMVLFGTQASTSNKWSSLALVVVDSFRGIRFVNCEISGFSPGSGGTIDSGFFLNASTALGATRMTFRDCRVYNCFYGIFFGGSNTYMDGLTVEGGEYTGNNVGILLTFGFTVGQVTIRDIYAKNNTSRAFNAGCTWAAGSCITFVDNYLIANNSGAEQAFFDSVGGGSHVAAIIRGNTCLTGFGGITSIEIAENGSALTSPGALGTTVLAYGAETGYHATDTNQYTYGNGTFMLQNQALLATP